MWKWDNTLYNTFMTHFTLHFYKSGHVHFNTVLLVLKLTPLIVSHTKRSITKRLIFKHPITKRPIKYQNVPYDKKNLRDGTFCM